MSNAIAWIVSALLLPFLSAQSRPDKPNGSTPRTNVTPKEANATAKDKDIIQKDASKEAANDPDRNEAIVLLREMESTLEQMSQAQVQVTNIRKVLDAIDQGQVQATEKEQLKTNQFVRKQLAKDFRELRARARSVLTQVGTVLLPQQRGLTSKLKARWELETDPTIKDKIAKLLGDHEQSMRETDEQAKQLEGRAQSLNDAISILEKQLSYLDLVEESLGLSKEISTKLRELNQEIDRVVNALLEKEMGQ